MPKGADGAISANEPPDATMTLMGCRAIGDVAATLSLSLSLTIALNLEAHSRVDGDLAQHQSGLEGTSPLLLLLVYLWGPVPGESHFHGCLCGKESTSLCVCLSFTLGLPVSRSCESIAGLVGRFEILMRSVSPRDRPFTRPSPRASRMSCLCLLFLLAAWQHAFMPFSLTLDALGCTDWHPRASIHPSSFPPCPVAAAMPSSSLVTGIEQ